MADDLHPMDEGTDAFDGFDPFVSVVEAAIRSYRLDYCGTVDFGLDASLEDAFEGGAKIFAAAGREACGFEVPEECSFRDAVRSGDGKRPKPVSVFALDHLAFGMAANLAFSPMAGEGDGICFVFSD